MIESSFKEADNNLHLFAYARLVIIAEALNEDGSRSSMAMSAVIILGSTYTTKQNMRNSMRMRRKNAVSLVGRVTMRMRVAVSCVRMRMLRHRTRVRMSVLGLPSKRESLLSTAESNSSIFGRDSFCLN